MEVLRYVAGCAWCSSGGSEAFLTEEFKCSEGSIAGLRGSVACERRCRPTKCFANSPLPPLLCGPHWRSTSCVGVEVEDIFISWKITQGKTLVT